MPEISETFTPVKQFPLVSAVIPTKNRPEFVVRAVQSALNQTYPNIEVVVVIDGPDDATEKELASRFNGCVKVLACKNSLGGGGARNVGIAAARGKWIALLDDDDEWLPEKISLQVQCVSRSKFRYPIVGTKLIARGSTFETVWPRMAPYQPLSEYLLARRGWSYGDGLLQSSVLLAPRELFSRVPFQINLRKHQDLDWVLRSAQFEGAGLEFVPQPLAIWNIPEKRSSVSSTADWRTSLEWLESIKDSVTSRAYASFVATFISAQAAKDKDLRAFAFLLKTMIWNGRPSIRDLVLHFAMWCAPIRLRHAARQGSW